MTINLAQTKPPVHSFENLLKGAADGLFLIDRERRFVLFNEACERLTGFAREDVLGRSCACGDIVNCRDDHGRPLWGALCPAKAIFEGQTDVARQRMQINRADGTTLWVETSYTVVRGQDGGVEFVLGVVRDASETKAREDELLAELSELQRDVQRLRAEFRTRYGFENMVSRSPTMAPVFQKIRAAMRNGAAVLISGESGVGKEVAARTIHTHGLHSAGPFIPLNCSALPRDLIESELFGHLKGSFTGAVQDNVGLLRAAEGGTVFLDEIGQMPMETQAKLLRVLQDKRVRPVGGTSEIPINVRVIAAMNAMPRQAVADGTLRQDLYYRLSVIAIELPPLRKRREDIPLLVEGFIEEFNRQSHRQVSEVAPDAWKTLFDYAWPGNVRELSNVVESAFAMGEGPMLRKEDFPPEVQGVNCGEMTVEEGRTLNLDDVLARIERETIFQALRAAGGRRIRAAEIMGISRSRLYRRMEALGMDPDGAM